MIVAGTGKEVVINNSLGLYWLVRQKNQGSVFRE
jgi:hypothetical protein